MTLFVIGCSHTHYVWPTWADILAQEHDEYQNWGSSGIGNFAIMHRVIEMAEHYKFGDKFIVQWTYPTRFDFHRANAGWYQGGNLSNLADDVQHMITQVAYDPDSYEWHTQNYIELTKAYLNQEQVDYDFIAPDYKPGYLPPLNIMDEFDIPKRRFVHVRPNEPIASEDLHWTPKHHLKYLENAGFTITQKMLQYVNGVEETLDDISNWKQINRNMRLKGYLQEHAYGR